MEHKIFLKSLTPGQRAKLVEQNNAPALIRLVLHWGLIIVVGLYIGFELPFWGILILPQGILIAFCFCLLHETVHGTPFKSNRLNTIIGTVCSYMIFLPRIWFHYFHMAHHKYTNDAENDPELNMAKPETLRQYLWYASAIPLWRGNIGKIFKNAIRRNNDPYVPPKAKPKLRTEARLMLATYLIFLILLGFGQFWLLRSWLIPLVLGQPFLRLYLLAEHGRCKLVANMFENTRTTFTSRIIRFLAWNMPYHTEHHVLPTVPFHKLPLLHQIMAGKLCNTSDGYMEFHREYIETLNGATTD